MKKKYVIGTSVIILGMLTSGLIASIAWFNPGTNTFKTDVSGSVVEEYFHSGDGSSGNPFVITRPMHYYHLVEFFQRKTVLGTSRGDVTFGSDYLYFQIGCDLDGNAANGYEVYAYNNDGTFDSETNTSKILNLSYFSGENALMPIGTSECPFFGSFNGGLDDQHTNATPITIQNLNIKSSEEVVLHGQSSKTTRYTSDVGMFGYVADADANSHTTSIHNIYVDQLTIDLTGAELNKTTSSGVSHSTAHPDEIYVGYIVGHMHTYTNYKADGNGDGNANDPANASPLYDVYVNNAKITGGADGAICNFGYVGYADTIDNNPGSDYYLAAKISALKTAAEQAAEANRWGGSINSKTYTNLLYNVNHSTTGETTNTYSGDGGFVVKKTASATTDPNNSQVVYRLRDGAYLPLKFTDANRNQAALSNTGYLVGSNVGSAANASPKISSYKMVNLQNALTNTRSTNMGDTYKAANIAYTDSKLEVMTYQNGWKRIKDSHNTSNNSTNAAITSYTKTDLANFNFVKYAASRDSLKEVLESSPFVHGIHFDNNAVSTSSLITVPANTARINGSRVTTSYQLPKGSIDFNLKEEGLINFFAATYNSSQVNLNFFSLYQVTRNASGNITALTQIKKIYQASSGTGYVYQTGNNKPSGAGDLAFDVETILHGNAPVINMMYYFEIPVNAGEYAMGVAGSTQGAYMIYLDLAANGSEEEEEETDLVSDDPIFTQMEYLSSGYVINSCFNIGFVVPDDSTKSNFSVVVSRSGDVFDVTVVNTTGNDVTLYILLVDNDTAVAAYPYSYTLTYNPDAGGTKSEEYATSAVWEGTSGGTTLAHPSS